MTRARLDGLCLLSLGAIVVLLLMIFLARAHSSGAFQDFIADYYSSRCLLHHEDPYLETTVLDRYRAEGGERPLAGAGERAIATRYVYPPTAFVLMVPFALLPWGSAHLLWMATSCGLLILASCLAWDLAASHAPVLAGALIGFLLANSEVVVVLCNPSGLAISLCVIAVWCFVRVRFTWLGVVCLALSLAVKPQDAGLVWLYFLLGSAAFRKLALQTLAAVIALSLPFIAWVSEVAPHWWSELRANLAAFSVRGGLNDPGPSSGLAHDLVDLQVIVSRFVDVPRVYNMVSVLIVLPLLVMWIVATVRSRSNDEAVALGIASIALLTLLPVHHHLYDTKLLLLVVPALAMLWLERGRVGRAAMALTLCAFLVTGDLTSTLLLRIVFALPLPADGFGGWFKSSLMVFPAPLMLLATAAFYLAVYWRSTSRPSLEP
jgi:alpha-1,2-mannosyltransferase